MHTYIYHIHVYVYIAWPCMDSWLAKALIHVYTRIHVYIYGLAWRCRLRLACIHTSIHFGTVACTYATSCVCEKESKLFQWAPAVHERGWVRLLDRRIRSRPGLLQLGYGGRGMVRTCIYVYIHTCIPTRAVSRLQLRRTLGLT
jgi:hypothetical protein